MKTHNKTWLKWYSACIEIHKSIVYDDTIFTQVDDMKREYKLDTNIMY